MDIRRNRIEAQLDKVKQLIEENEVEIAANELKMIVKELETICQSKGVPSYSFNHVLEAYYFLHIYQKGKAEEEIRFCEYEMNAIYKLYGAILISLNKKDEAIRVYNKALNYNPVDLDSLFSLAELYKAEGRIDSVKKVSREAYPYCCTRADMAKYYRNLGFYYLQKYKPEYAEALYQYSNLFNHTEMADKELMYISKALNRNLKSYSTKELQDILTAKKIPLGPSPETVALTYEVGRMLEQEGRLEEAGDCFSMVENITDESMK